MPLAVAFFYRRLTCAGGVDNRRISTVVGMSLHLLGPDKKHPVRELGGGLKRAYRRGRAAVTTVMFDRRYGVVTEARIELDSLEVDPGERCGYQPSALRSLRRILPTREVTDQDVFLDAGSGMGRVVLQAAMGYSFRRVIGVELSATLDEVARRNVTRSRHRLRCPDVRLVHADILDYEIPDDVTVVFLYNPFLGEVFARFIDRLLESVDRRPRTVRLIYGNPREENALLATGRVRPVRRVRGWRPSPEWSRSNSTRMYVITPARGGQPVPPPRHAGAGELVRR